MWFSYSDFIKTSQFFFLVTKKTNLIFCTCVGKFDKQIFSNNNKPNICLLICVQVHNYECFLVSDMCSFVTVCTRVSLCVYCVCVC